MIFLLGLTFSQFVQEFETSDVKLNDVVDKCLVAAGY